MPWQRRIENLGNLAGIEELHADVRQVVEDLNNWHVASIENRVEPPAAWKWNQGTMRGRLRRERKTESWRRKGGMKP